MQLATQEILSFSSDTPASVVLGCASMWDRGQRNFFQTQKEPRTSLSGGHQGSGGSRTRTPKLLRAAGQVSQRQRSTESRWNQKTEAKHVRMGATQAGSVCSCPKHSFWVGSSLPALDSVTLEHVDSV